MSSNNEQDSTTTVTSTDGNDVPDTTSTLVPDQTATVEQVQPVADVQERKSASSWFTNFTISPALTSQLTSISSSIMQVTAKVSAAANTLVLKSLPQRPSTPDGDDDTVESRTQQHEQTIEQQTKSNDTGETVEGNKHLTSMYRKLHVYVNSYFD
jgi:hypothetical protein